MQSRRDGGTEREDLRLWQSMLIFSRSRLIPFYVLAEVYQPAYVDQGLVSTRFMVSLGPGSFDQYLAQLGHAALVGRPLVNFDSLGPTAGEPKKVRSQCRRLYNELLTRALLHYLLRSATLEEEQAKRIVCHADTRRNFAVLIGYPVHAETRDCAGARETVLDDFQLGPFPEDRDDACLEYYGYLLRKELLVLCRR